MSKSNTNTAQIETTPVTVAAVAFDFKAKYEELKKVKSPMIRYMATLPEFQKSDGKPDMGKINKAFNEQPDDLVPAPKMRYQHVRNVLNTTPKKS